MPARLAAVLPLLVLLLGACATGPQVNHLGPARYPPSLSVERLRTPPARPYEELAELRWSGTQQTRDEAERLLAEAARELGADAIVLGKARSGSVGTSSWNTDLSSPNYVIEGVAIRYRR
ncbi:MAG TPA: hypothetical protein VIX81_09075 [Gammaproteobacteria bacterium]